MRDAADQHVQPGPPSLSSLTAHDLAPETCTPSGGPSLFQDYLAVPPQSSCPVAPHQGASFAPPNRGFYSSPLGFSEASSTSSAVASAMDLFSRAQGCVSETPGGPFDADLSVPLPYLGSYHTPAPRSHWPSFPGQNSMLHSRAISTWPAQTPNEPGPDQSSPVQLDHAVHVYPPDCAYVQECYPPAPGPDSLAPPAMAAEPEHPSGAPGPKDLNSHFPFDAAYWAGSELPSDAPGSNDSKYGFPFDTARWADAAMPRHLTSTIRQGVPWFSSDAVQQPPTASSQESVTTSTYTATRPLPASVPLLDTTADAAWQLRITMP